MNAIETHSERTDGLPVSAFFIVGLWTVVELAVLWLVLNGNFTGQGDTIQLLLKSSMMGGLMAAILMACGWVLLCARPKAKSFSAARLRQRAFDCVVCMIPLGVLAVSMIDRGASARVDTVASLLMFVTGVYLTFSIYRSYFRPRLYGGGNEVCDIDVSNRVSIREIMLLTGLVAMVLATCKWLVGGLHGDLIMAGVIGMVLALNWLVTSMWILGRPIFLLLMGGFVLTEILGLGFAVYLDEYNQWDDTLVAISTVSGMQLHLMLFLGAMRACDFRFYCLRGR